MKADLILARGIVRTLGRAGLAVHSHLAIAGGIVVAAGGAELMGLRGPRTRVIDLDGAAVLPGFNDAHAHVVYYGLTRFGADLSGTHSVAEIVARLRDHGRSLKPGEWQQGMGYRAAELAEKRAPHRLDSAALAAAGITDATKDPPGGRIGRDTDGTPTGLLLETAMRLVADVQPPPSIHRRTQGILKAQRLLISRGITSVGAAVNRGFADDLRAFQQLAERGRLKVRVNEFLSWELLEASAGLGIRAGFGGQLVRAGPIKVFVDGGAERIATRAGKSVWRTPPAELRELVAIASKAGLQVAAHAIGDGAIAAMCDAVESAGAVTLRHRVEHCLICPPDLQRRLARLGMVAVMQPMAVRFAREFPSATFQAHDRWHFAAHGPLLKAGVPVAFSSDLPVAADPNPWPGIRAAVEDRINGISELAALRAYTSAGAYASFEEDVKGTLDPGRLADLQVYDVDPLAEPRARWERLRPRAVLLGGVTVFGELS